MKDFKEFGTKKDGIILMVNEHKLTIDIINQIKNYLKFQEIN